ncbi:MAG TPA: hypothetical protein PK328_04350, partial [Chitinophagaceae bacterium]|nr:hypothetical protein [Chitinophagaceae bacterium]
PVYLSGFFGGVCIACDYWGIGYKGIGFPGGVCLVSKQYRESGAYQPDFLSVDLVYFSVGSGLAV